MAAGILFVGRSRAPVDSGTIYNPMMEQEDKDNE